MRLDTFLKVSRLCPRRTLAQELCDAGFVLLNGRVAKSAHQVKALEEITLRRRDRVIKLRVLRVPETSQISRKDATSIYLILSEVEVSPTV